MTREIEMSTKYEPQQVETGRYKKWLEQGVFKPNGDKKAKPYSVVIPPPNVTGKLHLGHAWDTTLQDMIIRQKRMQGFDTLWLPGMDHAGIATQAKVEARLAEQGISRYDLGREKFIETVWKWKDEYADIIHQQWKKLGLSLDYDRERFTLDDGLSKAVRKVFVTLYKKGLIYRGEYIINWDPKARTALSDIEVIHKDIKGAFYHVKYPFADDTKFNGKNYIEIATTRPETMMGDVAVAVHPSDERYKDIVGKTLILPLQGRKIKIIADEYVDPEFGTGMVKITPAHDPNDFAVGNRHDLERINTMNEDASMNANAGKYEGMDRFEARKAIVADLDAEGYLLRVEPITHSVGHSERTGVQVEARLSTQWFVKMKPLAEVALANQKSKQRVNFVPDRFENTFTQWMENVHDWVISRQLWWGHQIPAWYHKETGEIYVGEEAPQDIENWVQDEDVLDTWFSSALWPFSTMGWPDENAADFKRYFPTDTLVTGYDIIFFWVSRMIFQSLEFTKERPFKHVLIHGLIRDENGVKMSKSLGNGIDPMDVIDKYGADALRWFLSNGSAPGQDVRFSYTKMDAAWNFINKIWNASRFVIMNLDDETTGQLPAREQWKLSDKWIISRLNETIGEVTRLFDSFEFGEAGRALYNFIWNDFCDWYIEMSKEDLNGTDEQAKKDTQNILCYVLDQTLRLLHPIMPFVTEKIWLEMPHEGESLVTAKYPEYNAADVDEAAQSEMENLIELIKAVRNSRAEVNAPMSSAIEILIKTSSEKTKKIFEANVDYIERFCHPKKLEISAAVVAPDLAMTSVITGAEVYLPLADLINIDDEIARLQKEVKKLEGEVTRGEKKLGNERFVANAPADVVTQEREKLSEYKAKLEATKERIATLKKN
ncbi:valine--tRNA ligase [Liquorilactobacillus mali]|uniref:Valine--tRNA ligase n=1 Tax=Liquorilactobacillus mali KCTC 3596 = DSM 20444 TaxID=1046596 RepID=J0UV35_9LACO|nr:valine--tRNA ligase [Liquorilactobacillus mali]EJF02172.1 valyl-tRNA ligase [Liquorilactobacillus mali KCTC 3596 = DSM 20444]KRN10222.1 valyl-tRNA synthetase [Liquorilactobacillus mali KCTC 3596 = DSM 20444]MDC7952775.1 valine--tRNA ligase [Liquorilactobacillus mali]MDV7757955.1 valine--tRNA ligase [Liquorilactobacillus mali]QFQ74493.1 valine--tRNA ligase [Liquorilactobacillus mali]